jgi:S-formylglutathione hydrolase FrmB
VIDSISLVAGPFPIVVIALALTCLALALRWRDGRWKRQLIIGVPITAAIIGLIALLVDGLSLIRYQFPNSYYLWVGLVILAVVVGVVGWLGCALWQRAVSILAVALTGVMALTLINQEYQYYPTVGTVLGVDAAHETTMKQLFQARAHFSSRGIRPNHGYTVHVTIPGTVSGFAAREAFAWLPPTWLASADVHLPVIEMLAGTPGSPSDWVRAGFADRTAREFANAHKGVAPILIMPDDNGTADGDTECVNSPRGKAETYLTEDVPAFVRATFGAQRSADSFAVVGLSEGGTCAAMLALRRPQLYRAFGDYSGLTSPTVGDQVDRDDTTRQLFGGSSAAYDAHDPLFLLQAGDYPDLHGWFEVGTADIAPRDAQRRLVPLARAAGIETCAAEISGGGHDFDVWSQAFADSLPWLSFQLKLTPRPLTEPAVCGRA